MILGPLRFPTIAVVGFNDDDAWTYASHAVIEGKPRKQFVGDEAKSITLSLKFHIDFGMDPGDLIAVLKDLASEHGVHVLQELNGKLIGEFVIEAVHVKPRWKLPGGFLAYADVDVVLGDPGLEQNLVIAKPVAVVGTSSTTTSTPKAEDTTIDLDEVTPAQIVRR
jgi:phage protein U